jgi:hypothetical protein
MSKRALVPINVLAVGSEPAGRYIGDLYYNTDARNVYVFDGVEWLEILANAAADIIEGGDELGGSDSVSGVADGGNEAGGSDVYTSSYDGGGVV